MPRFVVVDPNLKDVRDASARTLSVAEEARQLRYEVSFLAHKEANTASTIAIRRCFGATQRERRSLFAWERDLVDGLSSLRVSAADHVLITSALPAEVEHLLHALVFGRLPEPPRFHVLMQEGPTEFSLEERAFLIELLRNLSSRPDVARCLRFYAQTDELATRFNRRYAGFGSARFVAIPSSFHGFISVDATRDGASKPRGRLLFVTEWGAFEATANRARSGDIERSLEWFTGQEYEIDLVLACRSAQSSEETLAYERRFRERLGGYAIRGVYFTVVPDRAFAFDTYRFQACSGALDSIAIRTGGLSKQHGLKPQLMERDMAVVPWSLRHVVESNGYDFGYVKSAVNIPLVEKLGLSGLPILCETGECLPEDDAIEVNLLQRAACALFLDDEKRRSFESRVPATKCVTLPRPLDALDNVAALAGCRTLAEVVAIAKAETPLERIASLRKVDLLLVGAEEDSLVESLHWFLGEVYHPHLQEHGVDVLIAGSLGTSPRVQIPPNSNVVCIGQVKNAEALYAATRIVIVLPCRDEPTLRTNTDAALAAGKAVVGTSATFRAFPQWTECPSALIADTALGFANKVLHLLSNPAARRESAAVVRELAALRMNASSFAEGMTQAMQCVASDFEPRPSRNHMARTPHLLVEFDEENGDFSRAALAALAGKEIPVQLALRVFSAAKDPDRRVLFEAMYDALRDRRALIRNVLSDKFLGLTLQAEISFGAFMSVLKKRASTWPAS